jgi:hypothetical protein
MPQAIDDSTMFTVIDPEFDDEPAELVDAYGRTKSSRQFDEWSARVNAQRLACQPPKPLRNYGFEDALNGDTPEQRQIRNLAGEASRVLAQYRKLVPQISRPGVAQDVRHAQNRLTQLVDNLALQIAHDASLIDLVSDAAVMGMVQTKVDALDLAKPLPND